MPVPLETKTGAISSWMGPRLVVILLTMKRDREGRAPDTVGCVGGFIFWLLRRLNTVSVDALPSPLVETSSKGTGSLKSSFRAWIRLGTESPSRPYGLG